MTTPDFLRHRTAPWAVVATWIVVNPTTSPIRTLISLITASSSSCSPRDSRPRFRAVGGRKVDESAGKHNTTISHRASVDSPAYAGEGCPSMVTVSRDVFFRLYAAEVSYFSAKVR